MKSSTFALVLMSCLIGTQGQQREDSYMEAYHDSHYPSSYFPFDDLSFRMPMENMQNSSLIPYAIKLAAIAAKILLKLTLFKIVVKFIAVICLFLFIPKLKFDKRSIIEGSTSEDYINSLTDFVRKSLQEFEDKTKGRSTP